MIPPDLLDRAEGVLLGLAAGDALGAPLVGMGRDQARIKHGVVKTFLGGGLYLLPPGEVTGRARLARAAAIALLDVDANLERVLRAYVDVFATEPPGLGEATRAALSRIGEGTDPTTAARQAHEAVERRSAGIGPAIRCVPYALRYREDPEALIDVVLLDARATHLDPRAHAAAAATALWVREHLVGEDDVTTSVDRVRERLADRFDLPDVLPAPAAIERMRVRPTAFAPDVLHAALKHALDPATPGRRIAGAANEAGAAAALGAVTGAVVGARAGAAALPEPWTALLQGGLGWRRLAGRLLAVDG